MKNTLTFVLSAFVAAAPLASANEVEVSKAVHAAVASDSSKVLEIVAKNISANESASCEIVKAAIVASNADSGLVAQIVEVAILEAPSQMRLIAQCAMATAPEAASRVQAILEKFDKVGGEGGSSKGGLDDSKDAGEDAEGPNPLDFPTTGVDELGPSRGDDPATAPGNEPTGGSRDYFRFDPIDDDPQVTRVGDQ